MIRQELVEEDRWITPQHFNRVLAVYQALPGPEAHELCVYFGMRSRGRIGGLLAGLGFMLPGLVLMLLLSWLYLRYGLRTGPWQAAFGATQAAVVALVVRAVYRIGEHALLRPWHWMIALAVFAATLAGYVFVLPMARGTIEPTPLTLLVSGLRAGLLTFGGAYTAIPFLQNDAVIRGGWMSDAQFLDGLALSGVIPAPFIIFGTFVGYLGGGWSGALLLTAGIFVPAFGFTLIGHDWIERIITRPALTRLLDGITAAVVGIIAATAIGMMRATMDDFTAVAIFVAALAVLLLWRSKWVIPVVLAAAALAGLLMS